jgi:hypothetical protein
VVQALEYQVQQGMAGADKQSLYLMPLTPRHVHGPELHATSCVLRLIQSYD